MIEIRVKRKSFLARKNKRAVPRTRLFCTAITLSTLRKIIPLFTYKITIKIKKKIKNLNGLEVLTDVENFFPN